MHVSQPNGFPCRCAECVHERTVFDQAHGLRPTLTEEEACADCQHQIYDHKDGECRVQVQYPSDQQCPCTGFRFKHEGRVQ